MISALPWPVLTVAAKAEYHCLYTLLQRLVTVCTFIYIIRDSKVRLSSLPSQRFLSPETQPQTSSSLFLASCCRICHPPWLWASFLPVVGDITSWQFTVSHLVLLIMLGEGRSLFLLSSNSGQGGSALGQVRGPWNHQLRMLGLVGEHVPPQGLEPVGLCSLSDGGGWAPPPRPFLNFLLLPALRPLSFITRCMLWVWLLLLSAFGAICSCVSPLMSWYRWQDHTGKWHLVQYGSSGSIPPAPASVLLVSNPAHVKV